MLIESRVTNSREYSSKVHTQTEDGLPVVQLSSAPVSPCFQKEFKLSQTRAVVSFLYDIFHYVQWP